MCFGADMLKCRSGQLRADMVAGPPYSTLLLPSAMSFWGCSHSCVLLGSSAPAALSSCEPGVNQKMLSEVLVSRKEHELSGGGETRI